MLKLFVQLVCLVLLLPVLLLSGCSDFDEMKSKRQLIRAEALLQEGNEDQAEKALNSLVSSYSGTRAAATAHLHLKQLQMKREKRERQAFDTILDSFRQVLSGYQALYTKYPSSLAALDASDYFFDSAYLEEITPEGYHAYLWLEEDGSNYRVWCLADEGSRGYTVDAKAKKITPFERNETLQKIRERFSEVPGSGKLTALKARD